MTCKDCVHYEVCRYMCFNEDVPFADPNRCINFHHQSRFVELPCEVGQTVYVHAADVRKQVNKLYFDEISISKTEKLVIVRNQIGLRFAYDFDNFGKTVFLSREEAENALKEREKE